MSTDIAQNVDKYTLVPTFLFIEVYKTTCQALGGFPFID